MRRLKLALVVPNFCWTEGDQRFLWHLIPYNLCLMAAMVRDICEVTVIDAYTDDMNREAFADRIRQCKPDVVGITVLMDQCAPAGHLAAELVKSVSPNIRVLLGGVYATVNPDIAVRDNNVDYVVIGEGEYVLRDLMTYFAGAGNLPAKGLCYRSGEKIVNTGRSDYVTNLDALPLPAYDLIDFPKYARNAHRRSVDSPSLLPYGRVLTSRGCPYDCCFCQVELISGRQFRPRSAESVLNEIVWLKANYGIQSLIIDDDNVFTNRKRAMAILHGMIDRGLAMPWKTIATAVFRLDEELIQVMRASGCEYIDVAIESGTQRVLKRIINKPVNLDHAKRMVACAKKAGIFVAANFIIGFPTETWDEIRQTIRFAEELDADYTKLFSATPLRHTRLWDLCETTGSFKQGFDSSRLTWNAGQIETKDFTSQDLTVLRGYEWDRINFTDPEKRKRIAEMMHIDEQELLRIRRDTAKKVVEQLKAER